MLIIPFPVLFWKQRNLYIYIYIKIIYIYREREEMGWRRGGQGMCRTDIERRQIDRAAVYHQTIHRWNLKPPPQKKNMPVLKKKWFPDRRFPDSIRLLGPEAVIRSLIQWGEMLATCSQKTKRVRDSKIEPFDLLWTEWPRIANQVRFVKVGFLYFVWRPSYTRNKKQQRRPNQRIISFENWPNNRCP